MHAEPNAPTLPRASAGRAARVGHTPARRFAGLVGVCRARMRLLPGVRVAAAGGWGIAAGFGAAMLASHAGPGPAPLGALTVQALGWLAWLAAGLAALSAAQDLHARDEAEGITALVLQRGHRPTALRIARVVAAALIIARVTAAPALALAALALTLSGSWAVAASRGMLAVAVLGYAAGLGLMLGVLARWAAALSPGHGRKMLLALVLGPHLAREVWPHVPSVPAWLVALFGQLSHIGGGVA